MSEEKILQKAILILLRSNGYNVWRINTTGIYDTATKRFRTTQSKGIADIIGIMKDGRFIAIEVKGSKGKVSKEQQEFIDTINANNGVAFVARSIDDVLMHIKDIKRKGEKNE